MRRILPLLLAIALSPFVMAQDEVIVLSPFEVSSSRDAGRPPIVLRKRADFLLLEISLVNDTREPDQRRNETYTTLRSMITQVPKGSKIELFTEEFTLSSEHFQIPLVDVSEKRDTSTVTLYAKAPLDGVEDVGALASTLRKYVDSIKGEGRTEIFAGDLGLSIRNPERYRYEVIEAIATDVKKLRNMFGDGFEIVVTGLDGRLRWNRVSVSEIELFLPFSYEVFPVKGSKIATE